MAAGDFLTWAAQGQDSPAHAARFLQSILLNEGVVDKAGNSFQVTEDTGANMNITIGSGTLGDLAVIDGDDTAGQGVYVIEAQNATVTKTIAASDPSNDRIDLVVLQNYDDEADSSGNNDAEVEVIEGTPAGSPSAPALPDSAIPLAEVTVGAGVTAITNANITDTRENAKTGGAAPGGVLAYAEVTSDQNVSTESDLTGLTVTFEPPANRRIRVSASAAFTGATSAQARLFLKEGATYLKRTASSNLEGTSSTQAVSIELSFVTTPTAASHTYKLAAKEQADASIVMRADAEKPAYILVEDLGPA